MPSFDKKIEATRDEFERIKKLAIEAGTSPRLAWQRIRDGWDESEAINKELRTKRLQALARKARALAASQAVSFLGKTSPPPESTTIMPSAYPSTMEAALAASFAYRDTKVGGENKYTKTIRELIEGKS